MLHISCNMACGLRTEGIHFRPKPSCPCYNYNMYANVHLDISLESGYTSKEQATFIKESIALMSMTYWFQTKINSGNKLKLMWLWLWIGVFMQSCHNIQVFFSILAVLHSRKYYLKERISIFTKHFSTYILIMDTTSWSLYNEAYSFRTIYIAL